jgi:HlyD family secretion protein
VTAIDLDEDLTLEESPWRGRAITGAVLLLVGAVVAAGLYFFYFRSSSTTSARATEDITVKRGTINQTLIISGTSDAELNSNLIFQSAGKVARINVKVGDAVKQGQVLAQLESDDLNNGVQTAQANLASTQLKLQDLLDGSTASEIAAADQAVASAEASLTKAKNDLTDATNGATAAELAAAQQAVDAARAQLATATSNRDKLNDTPSDADIAAAQAGVTSAQTTLTSAQNSASSAHNTVTSAAAALKSAESAYCAADSTPAFCATPATPISSADATLMDGAIGGANSSLASTVISSNSTYLNAVNSASSADAAVDSAEDALSSARKKLAQVKDGPSSAEIQAADDAVASAQAALDAANAKLSDLQDGPTDIQKSNLQAAVDSAESALAAAQAKRADAVRGPTDNEIAQAQQAVKSAQLSVDAANIRLRNAQIIAPFDGVVGAVNAKVGEFTSQASTAAPIVLLTPDRLVLKMDVGETDYANVKMGQAGGVLFDSIPGKIYPFVISEIGLSPSVTQGVTTYQVKATLIVPGDAPRPAPGMNARGQIITDSRKDVLVVPPRAIHRSGNDQVVDIRRNSTVEEQVVTTGASDSDQVEIVSGLTEGDTLVVVALAGANPGATPKAQPTLPGGVR